MIRDTFDPLSATDASTAEEALALALAWADGRRSWWNMIIGCALEPDASNRAQAIAICSQADAAEVAKWGALASALREAGRE